MLPPQTKLLERLLNVFRGDVLNAEVIHHMLPVYEGREAPRNALSVVGVLFSAPRHDETEQDCSLKRGGFCDEQQQQQQQGNKAPL